MEGKEKYNASINLNRCLELILFKALIAQFQGPSSPESMGWNAGTEGGCWSCRIWWHRLSATHYFFRQWMKPR